MENLEMELRLLLMNILERAWFVFSSVEMYEAKKRIGEVDFWLVSKQFHCIISLECKSLKKLKVKCLLKQLEKSGKLFQEGFGGMVQDWVPRLPNKKFSEGFQLQSMMTTPTEI